MEHNQMERKDKYSIGEVADLFKIPKSTLRYWDLENLTMMERNDANDYREYSLNDIIDISDIVFYRAINIPIAKLKNLYQMDIDDFDQILGETQAAVEEQIRDLQGKREGILLRKEKLKHIRMICAKPYLEKNPDIKKMIRFDISHFYSQDPYDFAILIAPGEKKVIQYGSIVSENKTTEAVIWEGMDQKSKFLEIILKVSPEDVEVNNINEHIEALQKRGYQVERMIGRYLITAVDADGIRYDYFKTWVEILSSVDSIT